MKRVTRNIIRIITGNALEVEEKTNFLTQELAKKGIEASVRVEVDPLTSIIQYEENISICEDAEDRCREMGFKAHCEDCKYFSKKNDKRIKWGICTREWSDSDKPQKVKDESPACLPFYEDIEKQINTKAQ